MDVATLLKPISPTDPAGPDLEYDPAMQALEAAAVDKPEQVMGDKTIPSQPANWKEVQSQAEALLVRSKHLRVAVLWCRARLQLSGHAGMRDGLQLIRGMLETYWDTFWPRLDPTDNNDPMMRMNIIAELKDRDGMLARMRQATLINSRQLGRLSLRDVQMARGELAVPPGVKPVEPAVVEGAFADVAVEDMQATEKAVAESLAAMKAIDDFLMAKVGSGKAPDLADVTRLLKEVQKPLGAAIAARGGSASAPAEGGAASAGPTAGSGSPGGGTVAHTGAALAGEVGTAKDVLVAFEKVLRYYERSEVSSPVPVLVRCAQRLVGKSFPEIAKIMTPEVVKVVDALSGGADKK